MGDITKASKQLSTPPSRPFFGSYVVSCPHLLSVKVATNKKKVTPVEAVIHMRNSTYKARESTPQVVLSRIQLTLRATRCKRLTAVRAWCTLSIYAWSVPR